MPAQLTYLNRALAHFEALWVIPGLQCFWSLSSISMGAVFFEEFAGFEPWMYGSFFAGVSLSLGGIAIVASSEIQSDHPTLSNAVSLLPDEYLASQPVASEQGAPPI